MNTNIPIGPDNLARWESISDAELQADIDETAREIVQLGRVRDAERVIAENHLEESERTLAAFRAGGRGEQIRQREVFIASVQRIQILRAQRDATLVTLPSEVSHGS